MPKIAAQGKVIECDTGENLRQVLLKNGIDLYNGNSTVINCHGLGTCGTCAVEVKGVVSEKSWRENARLSVPPHSSDSSRRLACQVRVLGDLEVTKFDGFWGQGDKLVWKPIG